MQRRTRTPEGILSHQTEMLLWHLKENLKLLTYKKINVSGVPIRGTDKRRKNPMAGLADWLIFLKTEPPLTIQIELKSSKGRQSPAQEDWQLELESVGHGNHYSIARSLPEVELFLKKFIHY